MYQSGFTSPGYKNEANYRFPRNIRAEGKEYTVFSEDIRLFQSKNGVWFYSIQTHNIKVLQQALSEEEKSNLKIYGDSLEECCICMKNGKDVVFTPCGHYCCCKQCSSQIKKCPMCRREQEHIINYDELS